VPGDTTIAACIVLSRLVGHGRAESQLASVLIIIGHVEIQIEKFDVR
jgi:hypothetical protein